MKKTVSVDIAIFGGGVAGLWLLNRLRQVGYSAILLETGALGGGQTIKSQGIIHGGMKYALQGRLTSEARQLSDMPTVWREAIAGRGELDLRGVEVLSRHHYLWAPSKLTAKLAGFFASAALASQVESLTLADYPAVFSHSEFKGEVFSLNEMVIDVPSLVRELVKPNQDAIFKIEPLCEEELHFDARGRLQGATVYMSGNSVEIKAQQYVFAAGAGNDLMVRRLDHPGLQMQLRPLHMVMVKMPVAVPLYAHCLGMGSRPRLTITSHVTHDNALVWYVGGALAEEGVERTRKEQIAAARKELQSLLTWIDFSNAEFSTLMVDRAEPFQKGGMKPESSYVKNIENMTIAWPTKLALAPRMAADIIEHFQKAAVTPQFFDIRDMRSWPMPSIGKPVWEDCFCKSVA